MNIFSRNKITLYLPSARKSSILNKREYIQLSREPISKNHVKLLKRFSFFLNREKCKNCYFSCQPPSKRTENCAFFFSLVRDNIYQFCLIRTSSKCNTNIIAAPMHITSSVFLIERASSFLPYFNTIKSPHRYIEFKVETKLFSKPILHIVLRESLFHAAQKEPRPKT